MVRTALRTRVFPILAWVYLAALGIQIFFAGMAIFVGPGLIELHRTMAHVLGLTALGLIAATALGRAPEWRLAIGNLGLLVVQGMLVHVHQWFGISIVAALHPVNAVVLVAVAHVLARRASAHWGEAGTPARADGRRPELEVGSAA